jgi:hypothetical protein
MSDPNRYELNRWNWGAFLLAPFWALSNRVWVGLLCWLPWAVIYLALAMIVSTNYQVLGLQVMTLEPITALVYLTVGSILGLYGSRWSWQANSWKSIEQFKTHQRYWTIFGVVLGIPFIIHTIYMWQQMMDFFYHFLNT